ncbi:MAG: ATP-dependent protease ATPase subunit HslU [Deltaproteobacteria bacterium]|nr:ATP-dependent protease ATPase subunit HslU [Deltaproteobacteria bacterium]
MLPPQTVAELDRYIIAQDDAKRAVAIALRNRWRRLQVQGEIREEITPKNIIMIGPTGVGKTEISRRLAKLVNAPFVKVEASKFTEVGYVGRDIDSIIRDLIESAYTLVKEEERIKVKEQAEQIAEEQLLTLLLPGSSRKKERPHRNPVSPYSTEEWSMGDTIILGDNQSEDSDPSEAPPSRRATREKLKRMLNAGELDDRIVEVETYKSVSAQMQILGPHGLGEIEGQIKDMFASMVPRQREVRKLPVREARKILRQEAEEVLLDHGNIAELAVARTQDTGIVFIDEIDKICGSEPKHGPDVSREGVQRDLLPLVEGTTVNTKYGPVRTEHILFIASGAFHTSKPSDLMPEFQGRFPIRVELTSLTPEHFVRILTEPKNALTKQYQELLKTENVDLVFTDDAIAEIAYMTAEVNSRTENIGARRLYTLLEKVLAQLSFEAHLHSGSQVVINKDYVQRELQDVVKDADLSRFIL